jgi:hypothetical protein
MSDGAISIDDQEVLLDIYNTYVSVHGESASITALIDKIKNLPIK